jgi:hypothetical protein
MPQLQLNLLNGRGFHRRQIKVFCMSCFAVEYSANIFILMIMYDFCLLPARIYHIIVCIQKVENGVQIADRCPPSKIRSGAENLVLLALQF